MTKDYLFEIKNQGITARLKRLSDSLFYSIRELYQESELGIEPNWHLIFLMLKEKETCTISEIAGAMQLSQPAIFKMINKMKNLGFIQVSTDEKDNRKKLLCLSEKALRDFPKFERMWLAGKQAMTEMLEQNPHLLDALLIFEQQIHEKSFKDRMIEKLQSNKGDE